MVRLSRQSVKDAGLSDGAGAVAEGAARLGAAESPQDACSARSDPWVIPTPFRQSRTALGGAFLESLAARHATAVSTQAPASMAPWPGHAGDQTPASTPTTRPTISDPLTASLSLPRRRQRVCQESVQPGIIKHRGYISKGIGNFL